MSSSRWKDEDDEDDEDEDVDFNPFLKRVPSREPSSSLSSDVEEGVLDGDVIESGAKPFDAPCGMGGILQNIESEDIVMQGNVSDHPNAFDKIVVSEVDCSKGVEESSIPTNYSLMGGGSGSGGGGADDDDSDAIWKRTRARYSLAGFSLDELETFLQETDDDDEIHNVDDQEEYRKFLAAVLKDGDGEQQTITQECENVDEEDEDDDADFQIEIEEALESDIDENIRVDVHKEDEAAISLRRPETRQKRRQRAAASKKKSVVDHGKRPLRPLLPLVSNASSCIPTLEGNHFVSGPAQLWQSSAECHGFSNGFTSHQVGQLHCLIYEHVQLLIQVYSLCALESSRQPIASQIQDLLSELVDKHDQVLAWRSLHYPTSCLYNPRVHPSVPDELSRTCPNSSSFSTHGRNQVYSCQTSEGTYWVPNTGGPVLSVLDVAPLSLVAKFMVDVSTAKQEHRRREGPSDSYSGKEPLFPSRELLPYCKDNPKSVEEFLSPASREGPTSPCCQPHKKTIAAALVDNTKRQPVALVPKEMVILAQRFLPLFNPTLYPHKPPPLAVAKRVLFTDSEDELLALGLMEFNTDWKAIQQRFLPTKSKHQIFVRQKNRCASKAPENPIKAVRRLKTSPLTVEETTRITEGHKVFKLDWMSIWKFLVPYRDPSMLPRQWRMALGLQKSYKISPSKKEKRRLYQYNQRCKSAVLSHCQTVSNKEGNYINSDGETNSGEECVYNEEEAYVHEAFLADWRPSISNFVSPEYSYLDRSKQSQPKYLEAHDHREGSSSNVKSIKSQLFSQPCQARKKTHSKQVKLAPDLPPINLPPSVRVISQSAFKSYHCSSMSAPDGAEGSVGTRNSLGAKSGKRSEIGKDRSDTSSDIEKLRPKVLGSRNNCAASERNPDSDLQMHPLLFQTPEYGCFPYYSTSSGTGFPYFSFSPGDQPQISLSLFHNSPDEISNKCLKPKMSSNAVGIDFHPLLRKIDDRNGILADKDHPSESLADMELLRDKHSGVGNDVRNLSIQAHASGSKLPESEKPFRSDRKADGLDLEIHLSSSSMMDQSLRNRNLIIHNEASESVYSKDTVTFERCGLYYHDDQNASGAFVSSRSSADFLKYSYAMSSPSNRRENIDNLNDQSLLGVVMEQEELSDSADDFEEDLEFECEEMADSEGEEPDHEETVIQDKVDPHIVFNKVRNDSGENPCSKTNTHNLHPVTKFKPVECRNRDHLETEVQDPSRPNRSCKKRMSSTLVELDKHSPVALQEPGPVSVATLPLRKSRKRACSLAVEGRISLRNDKPAG